MSKTRSTLTSAEDEVVKKFRVQLDFEERDMNVINELVREMGLGTRAELFRSGLRVLRWMYLKKQQGCSIVAITPKEVFIEPDFDFFDTAGLPANASAVSKVQASSPELEYA